MQSLKWTLFLDYDDKEWNLKTINPIVNQSGNLLHNKRDVINGWQSNDERTVTNLEVILHSTNYYELQNP